MGVHPVVAAVRAAHVALDAVAVVDGEGRPVGWASLEEVPAGELAEAVRLQAVLEARVAALRLHTVAAADAAGTAERAAAADTAAWVAGAGVNRARSWGGVWLASLVESKYGHTRAALAQGRISEEHAAVIVRAGEQVPEGVSAEDLARCEERLVERATRVAPDRLRRAARRLLAPLSARLADVQEGRMLAEEEQRAERHTALSLGDNGDGTWSGRFTVPELHGQLLLAALERLCGPRRYPRPGAPAGGSQGGGSQAGGSQAGGSQAGGGQGGGGQGDGCGQRLNRTEGLGAAFCEVLEHLPETGHTRSGVTLVVHVAEEDLRAGVGAGTLETGGRVSVGQLRRLACEAGIVPLVLGGDSVPVDLGRARRLFSRSQAVALSARHDSCAAVGCARPFAWCELHHKVPWSRGGPTDLANAAPLCGYHHRRVHDERYEQDWLPDGSVRFRHRWPSRWHNGDPWTHPPRYAA